MRYQVTMTRPDTKKVIAFLDATADGQAKSKAISTAKGIANGKQPSEVVKPGIPLKVTLVELKETSSLRVIKGDNRFLVLVKAPNGQIVELKIKAAGVISAYNAAIKQLGINAESVTVFVYDVDQVPAKTAAPNRIVSAISKLEGPRKLKCEEIAKGEIQAVLTKVPDDCFGYRIYLPNETCYYLKTELHHSEYIRIMSEFLYEDNDFDDWVGVCWNREIDSLLDLVTKLYKDDTMKCIGNIYTEEYLCSIENNRKTVSEKLIAYYEDNNLNVVDKEELDKIREDIQYVKENYSKSEEE